MKKVALVTGASSGERRKHKFSTAVKSYKRAIGKILYRSYGNEYGRYCIFAWVSGHKFIFESVYTLDGAEFDGI